MWLKIVLVSGLLWIGVVATVSAAEPRKLPALPSPEFRVAEVFDNRLEMWIELYASKDPNVVDYATGRKVIRVIMNPDGKPSYELATHHLFIVCGRVLWKEPLSVGVRGH